MADVTISYKGSAIATMDLSGTKALGTSGKYCEDDITVEYTKPSGGGTIIEDGNGDIELGKTGDVALITPLSVTENDTYTAPTNTGYSPVTVNVSGGGLQVYSSTDYSDGIFTLPQGVSDADLQSNVKAITATDLTIQIENSYIELPRIGCTMNYSSSILYIGGVTPDNNYIFCIFFSYTAENGFEAAGSACVSLIDFSESFADIISVGSFDFIK